MVLGIILYETADILYNVTKLTIKSVAFLYDWYTTEEDEQFVNLDEKGDEINMVSSKYGDNVHDLIYIKKIEELEKKINELNKKIDDSKKEDYIHEETQLQEKVNISVSVKDNINLPEKKD